MNYRHIYHAGNFADVLKHAVLARLVAYLKNKDKAFRVIDTHAGIGVYDLSSEEAEKTGEWRDGIGRIIDETPPAEVATLLEPYFEAVRAVNPEGRIRRYPGSPKIVRHLLRKQDRLSLMELHPDDHRMLANVFAGDIQTRVIHLDGWLALNAHVPPKERRGLVLVDPPFEKEGEYERMAEGFAKAYRKFSNGIYCLWYPLKKGAPVGRFHDMLREFEIPKILCAELTVKSDRHETGLTGSGLIIVNPPYTLADELKVLLPWLKGKLAQDRFASARSFWIAPE